MLGGSFQMAALSSPGGGLTGTLSSIAGSPQANARAVLEENCILGCDDACINKIAELTSEQQLGLIQEFTLANATAPIHSPSKWLFSKARTILSTQGGLRGPKAAPADGVEIPELPGVLIDQVCFQKMQELEPQELAQIVNDFNVTRAGQEIHNPSGWLFAQARSAVVQRITGGMGRPRRPQDQVEMSPEAQAIDTESALVELASMGIDEAAISKLNEMDKSDLAVLIVDFNANLQTITNHSSWLYSQARTRLCNRAKGKGKGGGGILGASSSSGLGARSGSLSAPIGGGSPNVSMATSATLTVLTAMGVDNQAIEKLKELDAENLWKLLTRFDQMKAQGQIQDPSRWLYSVAHKIMLENAGGIVSGGGGFGGGGGGGGVSKFAASGTGAKNRELPDFPGVLLDNEAADKLEELTPEERAAIMTEFSMQQASTGVRNPSGWLFGRARTKICERHGKGKGARSSPY